MSAAATPSPPASRARLGFTLIEIVGAFFLMVMILGFITGMFIENGRQRDTARELMRERLSAIAALDLIAADLEGAIMVVPGGDEAQRDNPWIFLADESGEVGARRLRFTTQNGPQTLAEHGSSRVEVAYFLEVDADSPAADEDQEEIVLWRWRSQRPPAEASSRFPDSTTPGAVRIAEGISDFGVEFVDGNGDQVQDWDSSVLPADLTLPEQATVSLTLLRKPRLGESPDGASRIPGHPHVRRIVLPMRPIDVQALIALATDEETDAECRKTIGECSEDAPVWYNNLLQSRCEGNAADEDAGLCTILRDPNACMTDLDDAGFGDIAEQSGC